MCVFLCMGGNSTTWMNTAVLVTCIRNFRKNRGPVSGILKGFVGLSTAIFTDVCSALFADDPAKFVLVLAIVPFVVCLAAILFLREVPPSSNLVEEKEETKYFSVFNVLAVIVAVYLLAFDITGPHGLALSRVFAGILLVLLATPLGVPFYAMFKNLSRSVADVESNVTESLLVQDVVQDSALGSPKKLESSTLANEELIFEKRNPVIGEEHTITEALMTIDFWILFISFLCGVGTGLAVMNNMGQMGLALGYIDVSIFVSLTSIWGFFGRILSGSISEYFIK